MTFDPCTNRIPFGLLTTEERTALQAKGPWEFANPSQGPDFRATKEPNWFPDFVYRRVTPPKTGIGIPKTLMAHLPPWMKWFARDEDSDMCGYETKPTLQGRFWEITKGEFGRLTDYIGFSCDPQREAEERIADMRRRAYGKDQSK